MLQIARYLHFKSVMNKSKGYFVIHNSAAETQNCREQQSYSL